VGFAGDTGLGCGTGGENGAPQWLQKEASCSFSKPQREQFIDLPSNY
jgi:hypothetical protein